MSLSRTLLSSALLLAAAAGLTACQPDYGSLDISVESSPPVAVDIRDHSFEVPLGVAVLIKVEPISGNNNDYVETDEVELDSKDSDVLAVDPGSKARTFVLTGRAVGSTCVQVYVNGRAEECIDAKTSDANF
ncbi:MAG: hypothetical protein R3B09_25245 [Nannocystaceae bacterium]